MYWLYGQEKEERRAPPERRSFFWHRWHRDSKEIVFSNEKVTRLRRHGKKLFGQGMHEEALQALTEALAIANDEEAVVIHQDRGRMYRGMGEMFEAEKLFEMALSRLLQDRHDRGSLDEQISDLLEDLAEVLLEQSKIDDYTLRIDEALQILRRNYGANHFRLAGVHFRAGGIFDKLGRWDQSVVQYKKAVAITRRSMGEGSEEAAAGLMALGIALSKLERGEEAIRAFAEALTAIDRAVGDDCELTAMVHLSIAMMYPDANDNLGAALANANESVRIFKLLDINNDYSRRAEKQQRMLRVTMRFNNLLVFVCECMHVTGFTFEALPLTTFVALWALTYGMAPRQAVSSESVA
jgi:tetratricopeptide (TPR) repeat protein